MKPTHLSPGYIAVGTSASAAAIYFGTGLHPVWWLTWLAPLPLLVLAPRLSLGVSFGISFLASAVGALNLWRYFRQSLESPLPVSLLIIVFPSAMFAFAILLFRRLILRGSLYGAAVVFPAFLVTYEYLQSVASPHGTALNQAYTQMNFLPILQVASITGIWGIGFCVSLFPATVAALVSGREHSVRRRILATGSAFFLLSALGYGWWRLQVAESTRAVRVGLIASDLPRNDLPTEREDALRLLRDYTSEVERIAAYQPRVIVLPEKIARLDESGLVTADALLGAAATRARAILVVGLIRRTGSASFNEARVYRPAGGPPLTYEKHYMLPPFESEFIRGTSLTLLREPSGIWGVTICKDMDFPDLSLEYARQGTGLLLVPAWDFDSDGWLHGRMAILRGIESGFSIARAPRHGILSLSDGCGRVLSEKFSNAAPFASLVADVPVQSRRTLYSRSGDYFAWLCAVILVAVLLHSRKAGTR